MRGESILAKNVNNEQLHRKSIRLKGYDYSREGWYFITICVNERKHLFGEIIHGKMILNDPGMMVEKRYWELEDKFLNQKCCEMVIMPNHFHCIIEINGQPQNVQAETNGRSQTNDRPGCPAINESTDDYNNEPWMV